MQLLLCNLLNTQISIIVTETVQPRAYSGLHCLCMSILAVPQIKLNWYGVDSVDKATKNRATRECQWAWGFWDCSLFITQWSWMCHVQIFASSIGWYSLTQLNTW